jgi:hypothetical protein
MMGTNSSSASSTDQISRQARAPELCGFEILLHTLEPRVRKSISYEQSPLIINEEIRSSGERDLRSRGCMFHLCYDNPVSKAVAQAGFRRSTKFDFTIRSSQLTPLCFAIDWNRSGQRERNCTA